MFFLTIDVNLQAVIHTILFLPRAQFWVLVILYYLQTDNHGQKYDKVWHFQNLAKKDMVKRYFLKYSKQRPFNCNSAEKQFLINLLQIHWHIKFGWQMLLISLPITSQTCSLEFRIRKKHTHIQNSGFMIAFIV